MLLPQTDNAENIVTLFTHLFNPRQASLFEIVQAHLYSAISVDDLASLAGRSLSTFKRDFEIQFNDSPASFLKQKKLEKAFELIQLTELSISEICYQLIFKIPHILLKHLNINTINLHRVFANQFELN